MRLSCIRLIAWLLAGPLLAGVARAQLEPCLEAYGGLTTWQAQAGLSYDAVFSFGSTKLQDHQVYDLRTRDAHIKGDRYELGYSGGQVWAQPDAQALGQLPARFYLRTPFYFFGMPFVFADPGAKAEPLDSQTLDGVTYDVVKITYQAGTGDSPRDHYLLYIERDTKRLKLVRFAVTYFAQRQNQPVNDLPENVVVFESSQRAGDLWVPKELSIYKWENDKPGTAKLGSISYANVQFTATKPDPKQFQPPAGATIDPAP